MKKKTTLYLAGFLGLAIAILLIAIAATQFGKLGHQDTTQNDIRRRFLFSGTLATFGPSRRPLRSTLNSHTVHG